jgi:hypothetical protein
MLVHLKVISTMMNNWGGGLGGIKSLPSYHVPTYLFSAMMAYKDHTFPCYGNEPSPPLLIFIFFNFYFILIFIKY